MNNLVETMINLGLGKPAPLKRYGGEATFFSGNLHLGAGAGARCLEAVCRNLKDADVRLSYDGGTEVAGAINAAANQHGLNAEVLAGNGEQRFNALVFDGSGLSDTTQLQAAYHFFQPRLRQLTNSGRVVILAAPHKAAASAEAAAAQRALEGLSRSIGKEIGKKGATSQLVVVPEGAEDNLDSSLQFLLSPKSAYVNAQVIRLRPAATAASPDWKQPLAGKVALVTGASRGIGESIARTLARDGAKVLGLDVEPAAADLQRVMAEIGGDSLTADITAEDAPAAIAERLKSLGGADIVVHNAGVTRDKTLANMPEHWWQMTIDINLTAAQRINRALLESDAINAGGRIVGVSSMNGIAGQRGQANYAASKAGVIGYVEYMADELAARDITINAVAPGFIETQMTAAIPLMTREVGRRLNSLSQGGQPVDVAEAIAFFASPASSGVSGNILRVCGQNWLGA